MGSDSSIPIVNTFFRTPQTFYFLVAPGQPPASPMNGICLDAKSQNPEIGAPRQERLHSAQKARILNLARLHSSELAKSQDPEIGAPRQGRLHSSQKARILKWARPGRGACTARKKLGS